VHVILLVQFDEHVLLEFRYVLIIIS
jgi:hypothetical protein